MPTFLEALSSTISSVNSTLAAIDAAYMPVFQACAQSIATFTSSKATLAITTTEREARRVKMLLSLVVAGRSVPITAIAVCADDAPLRVSGDQTGDKPFGEWSLINSPAEAEAYMVGMAQDANSVLVTELQKIMRV